MKKTAIYIGILFCTLTALNFDMAWAEREVGVKAGYDSNIDRAVQNGQADTLFSGYANFSRDAKEEAKLDWTLAVMLEGTAYAKMTDLNYATATVAPGLTYAISPIWSVNVSPFVRGKSFSDSDQSAWAIGGKINLKQQWNKDFYTGQYYLYTDSRADVDVYSYQEQAVGLFSGTNWTPSFFSEFSYEFSRGDSFRTSGSTSAFPVGRGSGRRFSAAFDETVVSEKVNRHSLGISAGYDLTRSFFAVASYTFSIETGDLGTSQVHFVSGGLGYRF